MCGYVYVEAVLHFTCVKFSGGQWSSLGGANIKRLASRDDTASNVSQRNPLASRRTRVANTSDPPPHCCSQRLPNEDGDLVASLDSQRCSRILGELSQGPDWRKHRSLRFGRFHDFESGTDIPAYRGHLRHTQRRSVFDISRFRSRNSPPRLCSNVVIRKCNAHAGYACLARGGGHLVGGEVRNKSTIMRCF